MEPTLQIILTVEISRKKKELLLKYFEIFAKGHYCLKNPPHLI